MDHQQGSARVHYGWLVLAVGTLAIVGGIGFGRFSYSTVLPNMQADLGLANGPAGFLVTLGLTGYLILAILGGPLIARFGNRKIATAGLVVGGAGMVSLFLADTYLWVAIFSTLAGLGSGAVHMSIFGLWPAWFAKSKRGLASGICVAGGPVGMVLASAALQGLTPLYANKAWQVSWLIFGAYTLAMAVFSFLILRDHPSEKGCRAIGEQEQTAAGAARPGSLDWQSVYREPLIWVLGVVYLIFGFTYISYMTFHVKHLVADIGLPMTSAANLYMLMGWISLISGVLWGWISDFIGRRRTLIILFVIQMLSSLFFLGHAPVYYTVSTVLYGLSALSVPAIMAAVCGDLFGPRLAATGLGCVTVFMGVGQVLGPVLSGVLADAMGTFSPVYMLTAALTLVAAGIVIWRFRDQGTH